MNGVLFVRFQFKDICFFLHVLRNCYVIYLVVFVRKDMVTVLMPSAIHSQERGLQERETFKGRSFIRSRLPLIFENLLLGQNTFSSQSLLQSHYLSDLQGGVRGVHPAPLTSNPVSAPESLPWTP